MKKHFLLFTLPLCIGFSSALSVQYAVAHEGHRESNAAEANQISGTSAYNLKIKWTSEEGDNVDLASLRGHPVVAVMAYTSCESTCPLIVEDMKGIEASLPATMQSDVIFALFSFDSARDTPAKLKIFAGAHKLNLNHWRLFHGSPKSVRELAAVLGIRYKKDRLGNFDHSNLISLLDREGIVKFQQTGLKQNTKELRDKLMEINIKGN